MDYRSTEPLNQLTDDIRRLFPELAAMNKVNAKDVLATMTMLEKEQASIMEAQTAMKAFLDGIELSKCTGIFASNRVDMKRLVSVHTCYRSRRRWLSLSSVLLLLSMARPSHCWL